MPLIIAATLFMIVPHKRNLPNLTKSTETLSLPEHILECIYDDNDITKKRKNHNKILFVVCIRLRYGDTKKKSFVSFER